jgi:hypothetical protein
MLIDPNPKDMVEKHLENLDGYTFEGGLLVIKNR